MSGRRRIWPEHRAKSGPKTPFTPCETTCPATLPEALAVCVPADFYRLLREDNEQALDWRRTTGPLLTRLFAEGYTLTDVNLARQQYLFERGAEC